MKYIVAVYHVDLKYGGPEESGWWYDRGSLVRVLKVFKDDEKAYDYSRRLNSKLRGLNERLGNRPKHSVLSTGELEANVYENTAPEGFPSHRPHYE